MKGIYRITSPSNKMYIGQSNNIERRFREYKGLNCKQQTFLYNSFIKYGVENHKLEVLLGLDENITQDYLNHCEQFFMDYYREEGYQLMNLREAGSNGKQSEETRKKNSDSKKGEKNAMFGRNHTSESNEKNRLSHIGKKLPYIPRKKSICPHCGKEGATNMKRYHFDKCKNKINNNNGK